MEINKINTAINSYKTDFSTYEKKGYANINIDAKETNEITVVAEKENDETGYTKKELIDAIKKINNFLKDEKTHAEYSVHKDLGTIMVKIVDEENDKVILELPPENILDMVASMCKQVGLLDKKV